MPTPIEFWFDFSSPYAWLASERIEAVAARHGRTVDWRPFLLGIAFRAEGTRPLTHYGAKGDYSAHDFARSARLWNIPFRLPDPFPAPSQAAARILLWLQQDHPDLARDFIRAVFRAYFVDNRFIGDTATVLDIAAGCGIDRTAAAAQPDNPVMKARLRDQTAEAVERRGIFGAPTMIADGEMFWGADRVDMLDLWLTRGGW